MYIFQAISKQGKVIFQVKAQNEIVAEQNLFAIMSDKQKAKWAANNYKTYVFAA